MPQYELNFYDYWRILKKRKWVIVISTLGIFVAAIIYTKRLTPVYKATSSVKIQERQTVAGLLVEYLSWTSADPIATSASLLTSQGMLEKVALELNLVKSDSPKTEIYKVINTLKGSIKTERIKDTNIIEITITSDKAKEAADIANKVAVVFVKESLLEKAKQVRQVREFVESQLKTIGDKLKEAEEKLKQFRQGEEVTGIAVQLQNSLADLNVKLENLLAKTTEKHPQVIMFKDEIKQLEERLSKVPEKELEFARLTRDVNIYEKTYTMLKEKYEEARIAEVEKVGDVSIVNSADVPGSPSWPNKRLNVMLGGLTGLMLGFILAFVTEQLDTSISTIEDVEGFIKLPVLGVIPYLEREKEKRKGFLHREHISRSEEIENMRTKLLTRSEKQSTLAESYNILETNVCSNFLDKEKGRAILITSTAPKEGKSLTVANLGIAIAQRGHRVIIIDGDLRRPILYKLFGLERGSGLTDILSGKVSLNNAVRKFTDILMGSKDWGEVLKVPSLNKLHILTCGQLHVHPPALLGSQQMNSLLEELKANYDIILFDSPPVLPITDASIIGPKMDAVILIYQVGKTSRSALLRSKMQLESVGAKVRGVVLNCITPQAEMGRSYYYYNYRYYGKEPKKSEA